jgi:MerR family transcriptional regulator/heat shock protein HspR
MKTGKNITQEMKYSESDLIRENLEMGNTDNIFTSFKGIDPKKPFLTIGTAATLLNINPRTLRIYEIEGLIAPLKKGQKRIYSVNDLQWVSCIRSMIHDQGISIAGIKKLMQYTPCWNIINCPMEKRKTCTAFKEIKGMG